MNDVAWSQHQDSCHYNVVLHPLAYLNIGRSWALSDHGRYCFVHVAMESQTKADYAGWGINGYDY
jgi:hypothetical protein